MCVVVTIVHLMCLTCLICLHIVRNILGQACGDPALYNDLHAKECMVVVISVWIIQCHVIFDAMCLPKMPASGADDAMQHAT